MLKELSNINFYNSDSTKLRKAYFESIFDIVSNSSSLTFDEIIESLKNSLKENFSKEELFGFIEYVSRYMYATKGNYVKKVLNNKEMGIEEELEVPNSRGLDRSDIYEFCPSSSATIQFNAEKATELMKETIRKYKEEGVVEADHNDMYYIKKGISKIDPDLFIDYIIARYSLKPVTIEELEQFKEMLEFFKGHLKSNISKFESLDPEEDFDQVKSLYVEGQNALDKSYTSSPRKLRTWKLTTMKNNLSDYESATDVLEILLNNGNFKDKRFKMGSYTKNRLKTYDPITYDYLEQFSQMSKVAIKMFDKNHDFTNAKRDELEALYVKKLILKDNSVDNE